MCNVFTVLYFLAQNGNSAKIENEVKNIFSVLKWCWIMGLDQLTFVQSCWQLGKWGILSLFEYYSIYEAFCILTYKVKNTIF